jgi:hypothetical protein
LRPPFLPPLPSPHRLALASLALAAALVGPIGSGAAQPSGAPPPSGAAGPASASARPGPFLAASIGGGQVGDAAPGLTGSSPGLRGRLELGYGDGRFIRGALALVLARSSYTNAIAPPEMILADADLDLTRIGAGAVAEAHLPLGRLSPSLGAGVFADRMKASAGGVLLGISGDYFETSDLGLGVEARAGLDVRVHAVVQLGLRAGWSWTRADLGELTDGAEWLSGPWLELRLTFDTTGFRMSSGPAGSQSPGPGLTSRRR